MSRAKKAPAPADGLAAYWRALHRTNVTGLATRDDYEIAFGPLARERRVELCGQVSFALALREAGVRIEEVIEVGTYPPDLEVPPHVHEFLLDMEEVVDATGTQVLDLREQGGPGADRFTVEARQECGIWMVAFGDAVGTKVRRLAWTLDDDGWQVSAYAQDQATRHGWPRAEYERLQADFGDLLPDPNSEEIASLTTGRPAAPTDDVDRTPWITYAEMADLIAR